MEIASHIHIITTILGFVCAMFCAAIMLKLNTDEQKRSRARIARRIAPITWFAFIILILSGVILTLQEEEVNIPILITKHLLVAILLIDATLIHFRYFPRFFKQIGTSEFNKTYTMMRRIGTLSVSCWIIILVLSILLDHLS